MKENENLRAALIAFIKAYGSQDSHTEGLDKACTQAHAALGQGVKEQ